MDKILFIVPPNISYEDFINPPDNVKIVQKNSGNYEVVITDIFRSAIFGHVPEKAHCDRN